MTAAVSEAPTSTKAKPGEVPRARVAALSFFFPAHNEAENIEALVAEALEELPKLADEFEIIAVDDGSRDATPEIADRLAAGDARIRVIHHAVNQGYGAAVRSGLRAARYDLVAFTDGDRQFRIADLSRLLDRMAKSDNPDVVAGYRLKRADPFIRTAYARAYRLALNIFYRLGVSDVDCAFKLFKREAPGGHPPGVGRRVHVGRAADQAQAARANDRRSRRAALPAHCRVAHRCETIRDLPRGPRFLAAARPAVDQPGRCSGAGRAGRQLVDFLSRGGGPRWARRADPC